MQNIQGNIIETIMIKQDKKRIKDKSKTNIHKLNETKKKQKKAKLRKNKIKKSQLTNKTIYKKKHER